jgi:hypothetical protein
MKAFLQRFALLVTGILNGFDRLVFKGRLTQLYSPEGMNILLGANHINRSDFKTYAAQVTSKVLMASLVPQAKESNRFLYLTSTKTSKEEVAREFAVRNRVQEGLVCVLQCVEPCWTFARVRSAEGPFDIRGDHGKCSQLYHYYIHPKFGWMYVRLQTWFPFEIQVGMNGREWLARQLDREKIKYERSDNKFLWVEDWQRAQELLDEQLQTDWVSELTALQKQVHPLHPWHVGRRMHVPYNWTVFQSEWATDVAFHSEKVLESYFDRWLRQALLSYNSVDVLRFLGRSGRLTKSSSANVESNIHHCFEGRRIKHWVDQNSLKLYNHRNVLREEMTINNAEKIKVFRRSGTDPNWQPMWRQLRRSVVDVPLRAQVGQQANERYLDALTGLAETRTVKEIVEPLTRRVPEPKTKSNKPARHIRAMNPLASEDAALLAAISDPKWMIQGLRNRDLVAVFYPEQSKDEKERRRRSAKVTRALRLLRAHQLLEKIPGTHRYQVSMEARIKIDTLLAIRNANPDELTTKAA